MRIRFTRDYRGVLTGENFYPAGEVADLPHGAAIVAEGAAEPVPDEPDPPPAPRRRRAAAPTEDPAP